MAKTYSDEKKALLHRAADVVDANPEIVKVDLVHTEDGLDFHCKMPFVRGADKNDPYRLAFREMMHAADALHGDYFRRG
jgi:hypothetical protein